MKKHHTCDELGVCQGLGADQCPDCDSFECEVPCADQPAPTRPLSASVYPFAPGVIDGLPCPALTLRTALPSLARLLAGCGLAGLVVGYLVERAA